MSVRKYLIHFGPLQILIGKIAFFVLWLMNALCHGMLCEILMQADMLYALKMDLVQKRTGSVSKNILATITFRLLLLVKKYAKSSF